MEQRLLHLIEAMEIEAARIYSRVEERPWGMISHNQANPNHHDANKVRRVRAAADPDGVIDAIIAFYRERGLVPRVQLDDLTEPHDFAARLQARGFQYQSAPVRIMAWEGAAPKHSLPVGVTITVATPEALAHLARIRAEANEHDAARISRQLQLEMVSPAIRYYLARQDGEPAACAAILQVAGAALVDDVATLPAVRGRGLATALIGRLQADAPGPLLLEVVNDAAERIYARAGFAVRGEIHQAHAWLA